MVFLTKDKFLYCLDYVLVMEKLILRYVLENAVKYDGKSNIQSVLGKILQDDSKLKSKVKELLIEIQKVVNKVNSMSIEEQQNELAKIKPIKKDKKVKRKRLIIPNLENAKKNGAVMRFAPNPNGAMTLGHSRVALWNWFFVKRYNGKFLLRMDDTDPRIKVPLKDAYTWFKEDLAWLGIKPNKVVIQSKRLKIYYRYAEELIKKGYAYVDTLPVEKMRVMLSKSIISDERNEDSFVVMEKWKDMFTKYKDGEAVLRIKTDIMHPNPAVRDWVAFRIIKKHKHPLNKKACVWPTLNFSSAVDDRELMVTYILRGSDLEISDTRQKYIYDYFGWKYPKTMYNGKMLIAGIKSTSEAAKLIKEGKLTGWSDPRLGTIKALRKRGFQSEAIVNFIRDGGIGKNDLNVNISSLEFYNRNVIDKKANRYFFVGNPRKVRIDYAPRKEVMIRRHPDFPKRGYRKFKTKDWFYVDEVFEPNKIYRFIDLLNFRNLEFVSENLDMKLKAKLIHWLPISNDLINVELVMPDNTIVKGLGESELNKLKIDDVCQLVRVGFCRLDKKLKNKLVFYFGHR